MLVVYPGGWISALCEITQGRCLILQTGPNKCEKANGNIGELREYYHGRRDIESGRYVTDHTEFV